MQQDPPERTCRICRGDEEPFYNPCICSGSIKHVHRECLIRWIKEGRQNKKWCELCGYEFEFAAPSDDSPLHHQTGSSSFNFTHNEESIQVFLGKALDFLLIGLGALAIALPNFVFFHLVYPMGFLIQIFCSSSSGSLFPHILLKCLFVCEFMYSLHFELGADHQRPFVEIISLRPAERTLKQVIWDLMKIALIVFISVHFGVVFPFFLGNYLKRAIGSLFVFPLSLLPLDVDSVFIGQTGMFSIYTCLRFMLQFGNFGHRFIGFVESLCFFKIALMIFFCFYASFGFIADIISFPLSHGSISMRFYSGDSNPMSVGVLYFLIGSEIIHFMSNPMVISHFRKGVLFFRPLNPNGTFSVANIYSVPFLLLFIYAFSCTIRKLFPTYGPVRFLSFRNGDSSSSMREMLDEIALMILLRKIRLGDYKPFSTTLFTKFSAWSVKRISSFFRLSSYLYGGRFPNEERAVAGRFRWVPKRNEFYQPEQLSIRQNTPVTLLDLKMKKIILPHESVLLSSISTSNANGGIGERSPPNVHASYDVCWVPESFLVRLYSFCFVSMSVVMVFFSIFLVLSIGIGWKLLERFDFAYQSDFFAYFFGRAILKFLMIPIYFAFLKSSSSPACLEIINFASIATFCIYSIIAPLLFYRYFSSLNPFIFPESITDSQSSPSKDSNAFHSALSTLIFLSCFLSGKLLKETNLMLKGKRFSPVPFVKFSLKLMLAFTGKWTLSKLDFQYDASFYALAFKMTFIALHCWRSFKTANKEASKEQIENLELQNYSDPLTTTTTTPLEIPSSSASTASQLPVLSENQRLKQD